jgi:hypothetical protein
LSAAARAALAAGLLLGVACGRNWDAALEQYNQRQGFALGHRCGQNSECASQQCRKGACVDAASVPGSGAQCGDADDCKSAEICEPNSAGTYLCNASPASCAPAGRVAATLQDCTGGSPNCPTAIDDGVCRVLKCASKTEGCAGHGDCCAGQGLACSARDGGTCINGELGSLANGFPCTSSDQCLSRFCLTSSGQCEAPQGGCLVVGSEKIAGQNCCPGTTLPSGSTRCCIGNQTACLSDSACCSGQCLAGRCSDRKDGPNDNCRQLHLLCGDDNDCCAGLCDSARKQCSLTPRLADGGSCTTDVKTATCASGAFSCKTPSGACSSAADCCSGRCENGACY